MRPPLCSGVYPGRHPGPGSVPKGGGWSGAPGSLAAIVAGSELLLAGARNIIRWMGITDTLFGMTVLAIPAFMLRKRLLRWAGGALVLLYLIFVAGGFPGWETPPSVIHFRSGAVLP